MVWVNTWVGSTPGLGRVGLSRIGLGHELTIICFALGWVTFYLMGWFGLGRVGYMIQWGGLGPKLLGWLGLG